MSDVDAGQETDSADGDFKLFSSAPARICFYGDRGGVSFLCHAVHGTDLLCTALGSVKLNRAEAKMLIAGIEALLANEEEAQFDLFVNGAEIVAYDGE